MTAKRRWPTERKLPLLIDGELSIEQLRQAIAVLHADGPETPMTLTEVVDWLELHVKRPHPPNPSSALGTRNRRIRKRYSLPAGRPGRRQPTEARAAA